MEGFNVPSKIKTKLGKDPVMKAIIRSVQLSEAKSSGNVYQDLLRSITGQQLSTKVAKVIYSRFIALFDGIEPEPHQLLATEHETLRSIGYSNQKARYVKNVAEFFIDKDAYATYWNNFSNEEILKDLTSIKGVGKWTVEMILMFSLDRPDIFPYADLGIQISMRKHYKINAVKKELYQKMEEIAEQWRPYRTYACRYLWAAKDKD